MFTQEVGVIARGLTKVVNLQIRAWKSDATLLPTIREVVSRTHYTVIESLVGTLKKSAVLDVDYIDSNVTIYSESSGCQYLVVIRMPPEFHSDYVTHLRRHSMALSPILSLPRLISSPVISFFSTDDAGYSLEQKNDLSALISMEYIIAKQAEMNE